MRGIDISNWQAGLVPSRLAIDFCIVKATEGLGYVDPCCDGFVQDCIDYRLPWGFYHFARENDPAAEARYFVENCRNYFGHGIPVLDYETDNANDRQWAETFCQTVYNLVAVWPMVYMSASYLPRFYGSWLPEKCGLWLAGYPAPVTYWTANEMPYSTAPWEFAAIWQFTSSLQLVGYDGNLDGNIAYMDANAWAKYAGSVLALADDIETVQPVLSQTELIKEILNGVWGTGDFRREALNHAGYDADYLQQLINEYYDIAEQVIRGEWGNGWNREQALNGAGYPYEIIQQIVNVIMGER